MVGSLGLFSLVLVAVLSSLIGVHSFYQMLNKRAQNLGLIRSFSLSSAFFLSLLSHCLAMPLSVMTSLFSMSLNIQIPNYPHFLSLRPYGQDMKVPCCFGY